MFALRRTRVKVMIKNIIFDVGKVLVSYEPDAYMKSLGLEQDAIDAINAAMFQNKNWDLMDQGIWGQKEALEKFIEGAPKYETQIRQIYTTMGKTVELYPYALEWLKGLKAKGYQLYILSNYSEQMMEQTKEKLEFLTLVEGAVFSYECKLMKPSAKMYEHLCQKYHLNCSECIFVDDRLENVEGAQRSGILAMQFTNYEEGREKLEEMLKY